MYVLDSPESLLIFMFTSRSEQNQHPIFEWQYAILDQPPIFPLEEGQPSSILNQPIFSSESATVAEPLVVHVPPIHQLSDLSLDSPFNFSFDIAGSTGGPGMGVTPSSPQGIIIFPDTPPPIIMDDSPRSPSPSHVVVPDSPLISPKTPPRIKEEVIDLCSPDVGEPHTPPRLITKQEILDLTISPMRPSVKRKHAPPVSFGVAKAEPDSIDLVSPPRQKARGAATSGASQASRSSRGGGAAQEPNREITVASGPIKRYNVYPSLAEGIKAVYDAEEAAGHKWILNQTHHVDGVLTRRVIRCNRYRNPVQTHLAGIDPSDWRHGKSGRTNCQANVAFVPVGATGQWEISVCELGHNHDRHIPVGGRAQRPPTQAQRGAVTQFSDNFSRRQVKQILDVQYPDNGLEPSQISNMRNRARREAREEIDALGGDFAAILASLEEHNRTEPGWVFFVQLDSQNVLITLFWQSPKQAQLTGRYTDILINDNSYNRNDKQYPLSIGIVIDSHGRSRNGWYAFQKKEDAETHEWIFGRHLKVSGDTHPEVLITDRSGALIAAAATVLVFTSHIYCLSHLLENIDKNLARTLAGEWQNFLQDFWACYRAVSPDDFETKWQILVGRYPTARAYLHDLYQVRDRWAWAWISVVFTAGIRTNGRVEVENRITKALSGPKKTLFQVFTALNERTQEQQMDENIRVRDVTFFVCLVLFILLMNSTVISEATPWAIGGPVQANLGLVASTRWPICFADML
jgi:hypothetical protein